MMTPGWLLPTAIKRGQQSDFPERFDSCQAQPSLTLVNVGVSYG